MASRTFRGSLLLGACLSFVAAASFACNTNPDVQLETYGDEAAEDYGCILGDLECACVEGNFCDLNLTCVNGICKCLEMSCEPMGPPTSDDGSSSSTGMDTDTMDTGTDSGTGTDTMDTGTDTMGTTTGTTTGTDTTTDTGTDTTDTGTDSGTGTDTTTG
ncbi:MAG: hypothetical protein KC431_14175 [Myxococcales bacterium]|nr:hypothetical protein [Myxococcales bacterium]MCA9698668.1 hypothetical protein [Myxococcales bacterium]